MADNLTLTLVKLFSNCHNVANILDSRRATLSCKCHHRFLNTRKLLLRGTRQQDSNLTVALASYAMEKVLSSIHEGQPIPLWSDVVNSD